LSAVASKAARLRRLSSGVFLVCEQARDELLKLVARKCCEAHQTRVQALQLRFAHRVKVDAMKALVTARPLQPAQENLGGTGIRDRPFS
jgi:hypothetical protein